MCLKNVFSTRSISVLLISKAGTFRSTIIFTGDLSYANLQDTDLTNTTITDSQLQSALSIRNAKLPNGTLGLGRNLVRNGDADCNISLIDHWRIHNGSIAVTSSTKDQNQCQFSLQSAANGATMSQRINLVDIWDSSFWENSSVELHAQISGNVSLELISESSHGKLVNKGFRSKWGLLVDDERCLVCLDSTNTKIYTRLWSGTEVVEVVVKFNAEQNQNGMTSSWCDKHPTFPQLWHVVMIMEMKKLYRFFIDTYVFSYSCCFVFFHR